MQKAHSPVAAPKNSRMNLSSFIDFPPYLSNLSAHLICFFFIKPCPVETHGSGNPLCHAHRRFPVAYLNRCVCALGNPNFIRDFILGFVPAELNEPVQHFFVTSLLTLSAFILPPQYEFVNAFCGYFSHFLIAPCIYTQNVII